jgi:penicillin amidase
VKKKFPIFCFAILAVGLVVFGGGRLILGMSLPKLKGRLELQGLSAQVDVYRDRSGIPHIYAQNRNDLMFAVGFVTAQDRLWQMDLMRRAATGRLAEVLGEDALRADILMRVLGLERVAKRQLQMLSPQNAAALNSFSDGVNACIKNLHSLPPEFHLLGYQPQPWQPTDSLAISRLLGWQLSKNYESEIVMMKLASKFGGQRAAALGPFYPRQGPFILPPELAEEIIKPPLLEDSGVLEKIVGTSGGSNSWVLAASRTTTGAPLLANDPHLSGTRMPSIWYYVHLVGGGFDVIGALVPGTPLPLLGHNDSIGWGLTNMNADVQDLYIERVNAQDPNRYEYNGAWVDMDTSLEHIPFRTRGGKTLYIDREIRRTIHGPVINDAVPNVLNVISLSWTGLKPTRDFEALLELNLAKNWDDFRHALASFGVAPQNFIYADIRGNIGYYGAGDIPIRLSGASMFPRSGWMSATGWNGFIPFEKMPHSFNPAAGYIVTANNRVIGDEYEYFISAEWAPSYRSRRIIELIEGRQRHDARSIESIQMDTKSLLAETICKKIAPTLEDLQEPDMRKAAILLAGWNYNCALDSPAALIYHQFLLTFARNTFSDEMGRALANEYLDQYYLWQERFVKLMEQDSRWFDDVETETVETRDIIAVRSFKEAVESLEERYGRDMDKWRWANAHTVRFRHPLDKNAIVKWLLDTGPFPFPGDGETINRGTFEFGKPYAVTMAASIRHVMDFSSLDKTVGIHTTGQSGHPLSRHYDDFAERWLKGEYIPLMMDRVDFMKKAEGYLKLFPKKPEEKTDAAQTKSKG